MAIRIEYTCDGCDTTIFHESGRGYPMGWGDVSIELSGFNNMCITEMQPLSKSFDLCGSCQQRLYFNIDPDMWPRKEDA